MAGNSNTIPDFLTHFFRKGQKPFTNICELEIEAAEEILRNDVGWRGDGTYLSDRVKHEAILWSNFIKIGGQPKRKHPIYMILGDSLPGPHDLNDEYDNKIILPLSIFTPKIISFTYPDSMYRVPLGELDKINLERTSAPHLYKMDELSEIIRTYNVYKYNNHYIEAQVWDDEPIIRHMSSLSR